MKQIFSFILFVNTLCIFSQEKKTLFYDEYSKPLNQVTFDAKLDETRHAVGIHENDQIKVKQLFFREVHGFFKPVEKRKMLAALSASLQIEVDGTQALVINFFEKDDQTSLEAYTKHKKFHKYFQKSENLDRFGQFFVCAKDFSYESEKMRVLQDTSNYIKEYFFKPRFLGGSFVIIWPSGRYYKYYGAHKPVKILEKLEAGIKR